MTARRSLAGTIVLLAALLAIVSVAWACVPSAANSVALSPDQGAAGSSVTATGAGWQPVTAVRLRWNTPDGPVLRDFVTDSNGSFTQQITIPAGVAAGDLLAFDLMTHDLTPSRHIGRERDLLSAPRLDNLGSCYAGLRAVLCAVEADADVVPVLVMFDHEEVGSVSDVVHGRPCSRPFSSRSAVPPAATGRISGERWPGRSLPPAT